MKRIIYGGLIGLLLVTTTGYAGNIRIFFSNKSDKNVHIVSDVTYQKEGSGESRHIAVMKPVIPAKSQEVLIGEAEVDNGSHRFRPIEINGLWDSLPVFCLQGTTGGAIKRGMDVHIEYISDHTLSPCRWWTTYREQILNNHSD